MADRLNMAKTEALEIAAKIKGISTDNAAAIDAMDTVNQKLKNAWESDAQRAYEECFVAMRNKLNSYTELLEDYSNTLKKVVDGTFNTDAEYANNIRAKYGTK